MVVSAAGHGSWLQYCVVSQVDRPAQFVIIIMSAKVALGIICGLMSALLCIHLGGKLG